MVVVATSPVPQLANDIETLLCNHHVMHCDESAQTLKYTSKYSNQYVIIFHRALALCLARSVCLSLSASLSLSLSFSHSSIVLFSLVEPQRKCMHREL